MSYRLRRSSHGAILEGLAACEYHPARREGAKHYADSLSRGLWLAKRLPDFGAKFAWAQAREVLLPLVPEGFDRIASPPQGRPGPARYNLARELAVALSAMTGLRLCRPLAWADWRQEASKELRHHKGKGRALGRRVEVDADEDLAGARVLLADDLWTSGITALQCAEALREAGAVEVFALTLAVTAGSKQREVSRNARGHA